VIYVVIPGISTLFQNVFNAPASITNLQEISGLYWYSTDLFSTAITYIMVMINDVLIRSPQVTKIRITSFSYGGAIAYSLAYMISRLQAFHSCNSNGTVTCIASARETMQDFRNLFAKDISKLAEANPGSNYLKTSPPDQVVDEVITNLSKVHLDSVYTFASPAFLTHTTCELYDNSDGIDLKSITYSCGLSSDPIFDLLGIRTDLGAVFWVLSGAFTSWDPRGMPGQYVYLDAGDWWRFWKAEHDSGIYFNRFAVLDPSTLTTYDYKTSPIRFGMYFKAFGFFKSRFMPSLPLWQIYSLAGLWAFTGLVFASAVVGVVWGVFGLVRGVFG
jgi:hypothetical protein